MNTLLSGVVPHASGTDILLHDGSAFFRKFLSLRVGTLIQILHGRKWSALGADPNVLGMVLINLLKDQFDASRTTKVTAVPVRTPDSGFTVTCSVMDVTAQHTVRAASNLH